MKCSAMPELLVSLLYGELGEQQAEEVKAHLHVCSSCAEIYNELRESSEILGRWNDEDPGLDIIFMEKNTSRISGLIKKYSSIPAGRKMWYAVPAAACIVFILLSAANFTADKTENGWHVSFGLTPREPAADYADLTKRLDENTEKTLQMVADMIASSEERQYAYTRRNMVSLAKEIKDQRDKDLRMVGYGIEGLQKTTDGKLQQTNRIIGDLVKLTGYSLEKR